jgi:hypothetical protein
MLSSEDYYEFFDNFIEVTSNPFELKYTETYKEGGEVKSKEHNQLIELKLVNSPIDLITHNSNVEVLDYYPKSIFEKIFKRKKSNLEFDSNHHFVFMSNKTYEMLKPNCKVFNIDEDDKVVIGKKGTLITMAKDGKIWAYSDNSNYKTILLK